MTHGRNITTILKQYYQKQQMIIDAIDTVSPIYGFGSKISPRPYCTSREATTGRYYITYELCQEAGILLNTEPTLWDSLAYVWISILALLIEIVAPLAVSYAIFMRTDIR